MIYNVILKSKLQALKQNVTITVKTEKNYNQSVKARAQSPGSLSHIMTNVN